MATQRSVIAVSGGSRGIGAAVVRRLAHDGYDVALGYRSDQAAADRVCREVHDAGGNARPFRVDVTDAQLLDDFMAAASEMGPLGGVVANAGAASAVGPLASLQPSDLRRDIEVNLLGPVLTCRAAVPWLESTRGALVLIGSAASTLGSPGTYVHYAAAKAGVAALAVGLAKELASSGIRVNCVEPGTIWTEFHRDPDRPAQVAAGVPLGRAGQPEDVAGAVAWLLSNDAAYTTGAVLRVAGGL